MLSLKGKHAVITGGAQGLGLAIARSLASSGARVTLGDVDANRIRNSTDGLRAEGFEADCAVLDVADSASVQRFFEPMQSLDILVNNAGIPTPQVVRLQSYRTKSRVSVYK